MKRTLLQWLTGQQPKTLGTITRLPTATHAPVIARGPVSSNIRTLPEVKELARLVPEMRKDYQVAFCESIIGANVAAVQVTVSADGEQLTELVDAFEARWKESASSMLDAIAFGRVAYEKVWGAVGQYNFPDKLEPLPFDDSRMKLADDGSFAGIEIRVKDGTWACIPADNSWWLALDPTAKQPHGKSRFKPAPEEVWKERRGAKENRKTAQSKWALRGPVIHGPETIIDEQTGQVHDAFTLAQPAFDNWGRGGLLWLSNAMKDAEKGVYETAVTEPNLQGFDPNALNASMERLDTEMLRAFGIPEKTVVEGLGVGTYGAVAQQMLILFAMIEGIVAQFVDSFQRYVIDKTLAVNGLPEGAVTITFVPLTNRPDAFVYEVLKLLLANPQFIEGILSGGVDVRQLLEQAGLPVTEQLEATLAAVAQRIAAAAGVPAGGAAPAGEFGALGRRQWQNNRKAVRDVLDDLIAGKTSEAMASELLQMLGMTPERAAAFIQDAKDGTVEDPELQEPAALAQVVIPHQGFKVPQASQVVNAGLREFDRLYAELVDAMVNGATAATLNGIRRQILSTEANMRIAGRVLGMLSPWQPRVNTYADGAAADETERLKVMADSPYRFPWIKSAVDFLESVGVTTSKDFAAMALADVRAVESEDAIDSGKRLRTVQKRLSEAIERGDDLRTFRKAIEGETALSRSQTETLYRTMTKRGYVEGFDRAMKSPVVAAEFPAVLFTATPDARVRDDHWDIDGVVVLRSDRAAYNTLRKASQDYNCRCSLIPLSADEAAERGVKTYSELPADVRAKYG